MLTCVRRRANAHADGTISPCCCLQELIPSELQFVSMSARKALSSLRYLPLYDPALVQQVQKTLCEVSAAD